MLANMDVIELGAAIETDLEPGEDPETLVTVRINGGTC